MGWLTDTFLKSLGLRLQTYKRTHRKIVPVIAVLAILMVPYQNCGGNFKGGDSTSAATSSAQGGSNTPPTTPPVTPPVTPPAAPTQDQLNRQACSQNFSKPTLSAANPVALALVSGLGNGSGDTPNNSLPGSTITATKVVTNANLENTTCATLAELEVMCSIRAANITQAISTAGDNLITANMTAANQVSLAGRAVSLNNCGDVVTSGVASTLRVQLNRNQNFARCVQGSVTIDVTVRHRVNYNGNNVDRTSDPQTLTVNLSNGCWAENSLKLTGGAEVPRLAAMGSASAIDGNWAAVVASNQNLVAGTTVGSAGAVHIYRRAANGTWNFHSTLQLADAAVDDNINAVVLKNGTLILGSAYRGGQGALAVYRLGTVGGMETWSPANQFIISSPQTQAGQLFGYSLAFDGTTLVVGAPKYSRSTADLAGRVWAYPYDGQNFGSPVSIENPDATFANKGFGMSVAVAGHTIAIGAPMAILKETLGRGEVHIYQKSGSAWNRNSVKLPGAGLSANNALRFGASVALASDGKLVIGVPGHTAANNMNAGAAVYYANFANAVTQTYVGDQADAVKGTSVALNSIGIFVGSPYRDTRGGVVEFYSFTNVATRAFLLFHRNRTSNDGFGWSMAASDDSLLVGARIKNDPQQSSGAAYIFKLP